MKMEINKVLVLGLGKVGSLVGTLLKRTGFDVTGADLKENSGLPFRVESIDVTDGLRVRDLIRVHDAVVSCLPYNLTLDIARHASEDHINYFDLTEDVPTTREIVRMSRSANSIMAPQCGLAPGFIAIVGAHLIGKFAEVRSLKLRVGALPQHPSGLLGYAFNWSPEGVVNEYLNDCEVIEYGVRKFVSPMEWVEKLFINGIQLEAFTTSGGLGTMCETYLGRIDNLDYKSIRYPGHVELMKFFFNELLMRKDRKLSGQILANAKPPVKEDVVYVHASVQGLFNGQLTCEEFVRAYYPMEIGGTTRSAISWTTAASACAVVEMASFGMLGKKGLIKQETICLEEFFKTKTGKLLKENPRADSV